MALASVAARYWDLVLAFSPVYATYLGDRRFDDRLDDGSDEAIADQRARLESIRDEVEAIPAADLRGEDRITRSALLAQLGGNVAMLDANLEAWTVDPLDGPQVMALNLEAIQPVTTPEQARAMVARWNALGPWFDGRGQRLRDSAAAGRMGVRSTVDKAIDQLVTVLALADDDLPLLAPLAVEHPGWSGAERAAFDEGLQAAVRDVVRPAMRRFLDTLRDDILPVAPCVVVVMPEHEERHSTIAYYRQPALDGSRPGQYAINTWEPTTRPRYEAQALAFHEAVPGHHLQLAISQELTALPDFRRHDGPTAYVEGWGLYTERLSDEMGLYSGDLDRIGVLSFDAWRACRLVVDTGMHALGWTRQQAIDYMLEHTVLAENNVINEVDRYIAMPGQALAYKIGQREIVHLRAEAEAAQGDRFDIRAFHDAVLGHGVVGLDTLGEIVRDWTRSVLSRGIGVA